MAKEWRYDDGFTIDCDFAGGNIVVERRDGETVYLHQDPRDTQGHWFYWCFRVRYAGDGTVRFSFTNGDVIGARGPAFCIEPSDAAGTSPNRSCWSWLGLSRVAGSSFAYTFSGGEETVIFCVTIPYTEVDLAKFLRRYPGDSAIEAETLCTTEGGRKAEVLRAGRLDGAHRYRLLLTARHHCCESMASYVLEGILDSVLAPDLLGEWYRESVAILAVPFMDKDGVEAGDQGKNRRPYDHNRDYGPDRDARYATVRAFRSLALEWADTRPAVALDLHCPYLKGEGDSETIYFVGSHRAEVWDEVRAFSEILEERQRGPLRYAASSNLPFGTAWNTTDSGMLESASAWMSKLPGVSFAATLETAYANAHGAEVNPGSARMFGRDLARAFQAYWEERG